MAEAGTVTGRRYPLLQDGHVAEVRPITPDDAGALRDLYLGLSERSLRLRYLGWVPPLAVEMAERMANVDFRSRFAWVAILHDRVVADCRLAENEAGDLELAIVVADELQHLGLGRVMVDLALDAAGGRTVVADVRYDNRPMTRLLRARAFERRGWELGVMQFVHEPSALAGGAPPMAVTASR